MRLTIQDKLTLIIVWGITITFGASEGIIRLAAVPLPGEMGAVSGELARWVTVALVLALILVLAVRKGVSVFIFKPLSHIAQIVKGISRGQYAQRVLIP